MTRRAEPHYRRDLALVHHLGYADHADLCAAVDLARQHAHGAADVARLVLPDDPIPQADAIVSIGHEARAGASFGAEQLPPGLRTIVGWKQP